MKAEPLPFKIYLVGYQQQTGKDEFAKRAIASHHFYILHFADAVKQWSVTLLKMLGCSVKIEDFYDSEKKEEFILDEATEKPFKFLIKSGNKLVPTQFTIRQWMRYYATEVMRDMIHVDLWARITATEILNVMVSPARYNGIVIPDFRFMNEYDVLKQFLKHHHVDLMTIKIVRPGFSNTVENHRSESELHNFQFDLAINNDSTLEKYYEKVDDVITGMWREKKRLHDIQERMRSVPFLNGGDK